MLQLFAFDGQVTRCCEAATFPFTIGRSSNAHLRLESPGVWDLHATISAEGSNLIIRALGESVLLVNDERSALRVLRMGDQLSIGGVRLTVALSPASQRSFRSLEALIWLLLGAVTLVQVLLILAIR